MQAALAVQDGAATLEQVVIGGDLSKLTAAQRVSYYRSVCDSIGLNPLTKPFDYLTLNGRLVLYARKDATDQLRKRDRVSITKLERERLEDVFAVTAYAATPDGRQDSSIGAVNVAGLKGDALANALMKAETKAKRRVTLSICGLGMLDETEIETIPDARPAVVTEPEPAPRDDFDSLPVAEKSAQAITDAQRKMIFALANKVYGKEHIGEFRAWLVKHYGTEHTSELTRDQASAIIDGLQAQEPPAA